MDALTFISILVMSVAAVAAVFFVALIVASYKLGLAAQRQAAQNMRNVVNLAHAHARDVDIRDLKNPDGTHGYDPNSQDSRGFRR